MGLATPITDGMGPSAGLQRTFVNFPRRGIHKIFHRKQAYKTSPQDAKKGTRRTPFSWSSQSGYWLGGFGAVVVCGVVVVWGVVVDGLGFAAAGAAGASGGGGAIPEETL